MSDTLNSRRAARAEELAERAAERAHNPDAYRDKLAMQRLSDLLEQKWWTSREAVYVFAGLHPELTEGDPRDEWGPAWLPGGREAYAPREDRFQHGVEIEAALDALEQIFTGDARTPAEWMERAAKFEVVPVWLGAAFTDKMCASWLPKTYRRRTVVATEGKSRGKSGGDARSARDPKACAMREIAEEHFPAWFKENAPNGVVPRGLRESFVQNMHDLFKERGIALSLGAIRNKLTKLVGDAESRFHRA